MAAVAPVMTSGNGTANNNKSSSRQHNGEAKAAQVIVKSHILTHLIEGFVIQEGAEPFPVSLFDARADQSVGMFFVCYDCFKCSFTCYFSLGCSSLMFVTFLFCL